MSVSINTEGESLEIGIPKKLFTRRYVAGQNQWRYNVTHDGAKFLLNAPLTDVEEAEMILGMNWHKELEER